VGAGWQNASRHGEQGPSFSLWEFSMPSKQAAAYGGVEASSPVSAISAAFSPDGRWVAYSYADADRSARILVQPFPATGAKYQISSGAIHPFWSPDGKELFFTPGGGFAVSGITTKPSFTFSSPVNVPIGNVKRGFAFERSIDIMPDGKRFVGVIAADQVQSGTTSTPQIQVVLNWFEELKQRVRE
jgi:Tol biopolymer transport system component